MWDSVFAKCISNNDAPWPCVELALPAWPCSAMFRTEKKTQWSAVWLLHHWGCSCVYFPPFYQFRDLVLSACQEDEERDEQNLLVLTGASTEFLIVLQVCLQQLGLSRSAFANLSWHMAWNQRGCLIIVSLPIVPCPKYWVGYKQVAGGASLSEVRPTLGMLAPEVKEKQRKTLWNLLRDYSCWKGTCSLLELSIFFSLMRSQRLQ